MDDELKEYIISLVQVNFPDAIVKSLIPVHLYFADVSDFVPEDSFLYYGVFNISPGGMIRPELKNSFFNIVPTQGAITNPILFENLDVHTALFTGYRINVVKYNNALQFGDFSNDFSNDFSI